MSEPFEFVQDTLRTAKIKHGYVLKSKKIETSAKHGGRRKKIDEKKEGTRRGYKIDSMKKQGKIHKT